MHIVIIIVKWNIIENFGWLNNLRNDLLTLEHPRLFFPLRSRNELNPANPKNKQTFYETPTFFLILISVSL